MKDLARRAYRPGSPAETAAEPPTDTCAPALALALAARALPGPAPEASEPAAAPLACTGPEDSWSSARTAPAAEAPVAAADPAASSPRPAVSRAACPALELTRRVRVAAAPAAPAAPDLAHAVDCEVLGEHAGDLGL